MYSRDELLAKHYAAGKCGAARRLGKLRAADKATSKKQKKRHPRKTNAAAVLPEQEKEWSIKYIVEHGTAASMARKYKCRFGANRLLRKYTRETVVYRVRWLDCEEEVDTFQAEADCRDNEVFEDFVKKNCQGFISRYLIPTEKTKRDVDKRLSVGRGGKRKKRFERGPQLAAALQKRYKPMQALCMNPAFKKYKCRLVYQLLDSGSPGLGAKCDLLAFLRAIFYVGMGTDRRPFSHLKQAKEHLLEPGSPRPNRCVQRIADIWRRGDGVIVLPVITKLYVKDAKLREAAIISLKEAGLTNLLNAVRGGFNGPEQWSIKHWRELGVMQLTDAFKLYRTPDQRSWYLGDIPLTADQIEAWQSVGPVAYSSEVVDDGPSTLTAQPVASAKKAQRITKRAVRTTSIDQDDGNEEDNLRVPKCGKRVPFEGRHAMQQTSEVAGTSLQSSSTHATTGAAPPQKTVFEAVIKPSTLSQLKDWHSELMEESCSLQIEELVKCVLPQLVATMTQVDKEARERATSRAQYYQIIANAIAQVRSAAIAQQRRNMPQQFGDQPQQQDSQQVMGNPIMTDQMQVQQAPQGMMQNAQHVHQQQVMPQQHEAHFAHQTPRFELQQQQQYAAGTMPQQEAQFDGGQQQ